MMLKAKRQLNDWNNSGATEFECTKMDRYLGEGDRCGYPIEPVISDEKMIKLIRRMY